MGGLGSGRSGGQETTDDYRVLDVRRWQRDGLLSPGQDFRWQWTQNGEKLASIDVRTEIGAIWLSYRHRRYDEEWTHLEYPVRLSWTPCHYGGERAWFLCPAMGCGRRVAMLYCGGVFACRHCYRLAYRSQRETADDRMVRRANHLRTRLGWESGILNCNGSKPKGMHWKTFQRLISQMDAYANLSLFGAYNRIINRWQKLDPCE